MKGSIKILGFFGVILLLPIVLAHGEEVHTDASFGPFPLELFEDYVADYNTQVINQTGDGGTQLRKIASSLPSIILPISLGIELSDTGEVMELRIEKDLMMSVGEDNQGVDLNLVLDQEELIRVLSETATAQNPLSVINNSNIIFQPKNFKSKLAMGVLEKQIGLNIKISQEHEPKGLQKFFLSIINKILGIFIK